MAESVDIQKIIYNKLREEGFSHFAALGVIANFAYETDNFKAFEEYAPNKYGTKGAGLAMWTDGSAPRRTMYEKWMVENNKDFNSIEDQLDYFLYELENHPENLPRGRNFSIEEMNKLDSIEATAEYFMKGYEAPQDQSREHLQKRLATLREFDYSQEEEGKEFNPKTIIAEEATQAIDNLPKIIDPKAIRKSLDESLSVLHKKDSDALDTGLSRVIDNNVIFENQYTQVASKMLDKASENGEIEYLPVEPLPEEASEEKMLPGRLFAEGGYLQPNGRITSFTRPEDITAQNNTINDE